MTFSEKQLDEEPKDRTLWIWLGIIALVAVALGVLWVLSHTGPDMSRVHAKHILIKFTASDPVDRARALELANDLRARIMKGESFKKLAKEFSNDEFSSPRGGDLGYQRRGVYEKAFEEYVWTAPVGQLSDIVQTGYGFHLITVVSRHISSTEQYEFELEQKAIESEKAAAPESPAPPEAPAAAPQIPAVAPAQPAP